MKVSVAIPAEIRESRGKNEARRNRVRGLIPAVVYGSGQEPLSISVDPRQITKILHSKTGHNTIFNIGIRDGETTPVMIVDWQLDPVSANLLHADLKRIDLSKRIRVSVPVHVHGDPKGVKQQDGLLEIVTREVEIECLPDDIPENLVIDVTELMVGQSIRAIDAPLTESMRLLSPADAVIAHVVALRVQAEPAAEAAPAVEAVAETAEPEVIKKGKKEEEEPGAEKGKKK